MNAIAIRGVAPPNGHVGFSLVEICGGIVGKLAPQADAW
jgi:hypothetical protein